MAYSSSVRLAAGYAALAGIRRLARRSGATDDEFFGTLAGDDVIAHPMLEWTRATTINVPPDRVWPWLVQMGYGRGGWYTSERFDRIVWRIENKSSEVILPEWQDLSVGDIVPDGPGYAAYFRVAEVREHEAIVYHSIRHPYRGQEVDPANPSALERREHDLVAGGTYIHFSWAFVLRPVGDRATRLLIRARADLSPRWARFTEPAFGMVDLYHVTMMFRGIRRRAEGRPHRPAPARSAGQSDTR
jgi:proline iminopeptidase